MNTSTESFRQSTSVDSIVKERQEAIERLLKFGLPPLPVAPAFPVEEYATKDGKPKFNGKNPSYLDKCGKPHLVTHSQYQNHLPTQADLDEWFVHPETGLGSLGGVNGIYWADPDRKNFESQEDCDQWIADRAIKGWLEQTQSGGYRFPVRFREKPNFTNFAEGELLGKGRFAVLAPTVGSNGAYRIIQQGDPIEVNSVEDLGIYPVRSEQSEPIPPTVNSEQVILSKSTTGCISLYDCVSQATKKKFTNPEEFKDRSRAIANAAKEFYGWENWLTNNSVQYKETADQWVEALADSFGFDSRRLNECLKKINRAKCIPGCVDKGGNDEAAQKIVSKLQKALDKESNPTFSQSEFANQVAARWKEYYRYDSKQNDWLKYNAKQTGVFSTVTEDEVLSDLKEVATEDIPDGFSFNFLKGACQLIRVDKAILTLDLKAEKDVLVFRNTAMRINSNSIEILPHSPSNKARWALERDYDPNKTAWEPIAELFTKGLGDPLDQDRVICFHAATLRNLFPKMGSDKNTLVQRGDSGTGRSTTNNLLFSVIGYQNMMTVESIDRLQSDTFALEGLEDYPRVICFPDQSQLHPKLKIDRLLALTGRDTISVNRKNRKQSDFKYEGATIINTTESIFSQYHFKRGMKRRCVLVDSWKKHPDLQSISEKFTSDVIAAYTNFLLSIPEEFILNTLLQSPGTPSIEDQNDDPVVRWFASHIEPTGNPDDKVQLGSDKENFAQLYGNYYQACLKLGTSPAFIKSHRGFSEELRRIIEELTKTQDWHIWEKIPNNKITFYGLRIKQVEDDYFFEPKPSKIKHESFVQTELTKQTPKQIEDNPKNFQPGDSIEVQKFDGDEWRNGWKVQRVQGNLIWAYPATGDKKGNCTSFEPHQVRMCQSVPSSDVQQTIDMICEGYQGGGILETIELLKEMEMSQEVKRQVMSGLPQEIQKALREAGTKQTSLDLNVGQQFASSYT